MEQSISSIISLIPARGGSKGIPRKNISKLNGQPLLKYTIESSKQSKFIEHTYLSSEDVKILSLGESLNITPIKRPIEFAKDNSPASSVIKHFLSTLPQGIISKNPLIVYLQPTSPLRNAQHIDEAIKLIKAKKSGCVVSVKKLTIPLFKCVEIRDGHIHPLFSENFLTEQRQNLPQIYIPNGAIYLFFADDFFRKGNIPIDGSFPYIMSNTSSIDIDSKEDFLKAEKILKEKV